jgi:hypothetical protein
MAVRIKQWLGSVETLLALGAGWVLVFAVPFRVTAGWLGGTAAPSQRRASAQHETDRARYVARHVARLARRVPWRATCLVQAVAGYLLLKRRGIAATIRFGVNKSDAGLAAHAWLIVGDQIVLGGEAAPDFRPLADLGGRAS